MPCEVRFIDHHAVLLDVIMQPFTQDLAKFMAIQWFPGHMTSARRKAAETMAVTDVVIEVVDARLPEASTNPLVHELRRQRPRLKVLNKSACRG